MGVLRKWVWRKCNRFLILFGPFGDYNKQNAYISGCISEAGFERKYTKNEKSQREVKKVFTIMHCGVSYNVSEDENDSTTWEGYEPVRRVINN